MESDAEIIHLDEEIRSRIKLLASPTTPAIREIRREYSRRLAATTPEIILRLALHLTATATGQRCDLPRFLAYELLANHREASERLTSADLLRLGQGLHSWSSVDSFAMILSGPMWAKGRLSESIVTAWTWSEDRWWRRAALVSTIALSRRGDHSDIILVVRICTLLVTDRDDMVVKALSWALRELAKKHPKQAHAFLAENERRLAARVVREVNNKLRTGLKYPYSVH